MEVKPKLTVNEKKQNSRAIIARNRKYIPIYLSISIYLRGGIFFRGERKRKSKSLDDRIKRNEIMSHDKITYLLTYLMLNCCFVVLLLS